jgi:enoyl-CoA hydratase/carnithine racemase
MAELESYAEKYQSIRMERTDGVLQLTFHTDGGPLRWNRAPHREWAEAFHDVGTDPENQVVIITGTGDEFSGPEGTIESHQTLGQTPGDWDPIMSEALRFTTNLLSIEVPMISVINGPALRHSEVALLCDMVLAADDAVFQDSGHFHSRLVPGDGMHVVYPLLMGMNRGRYFLFTGQRLSAKEALDFGLVNEVLPRAKLLPRAWELAKRLLEQPPMVRRYTRLLLTHHIKKQMLDLLGYGLALEGLAVAEQWSKDRPR